MLQVVSISSAARKFLMNVHYPEKENLDEIRDDLPKYWEHVIMRREILAISESVQREIT